MMHRLSYCALVSLLFIAHSASAATPFSTSLFDGQRLDQWIVTDCDAGVDDGKLVLRSGEGLLRSHHRYSDFVLELDWRARKAEAYDSGIYIRAELPEKGPWPKRYQINLKQGAEGNIGVLKGATSTGLIKPGDWNHFKITVAGAKVSMEINGKPAWEVDGLEVPSGFIGFQSEVTLGGQFEFRNIHVTETDHQSIFNGKDLTGWEGGEADAAACWKIENGDLLCTGAKGPWLRSLEEYGDFNLRLEYKLSEGGNSGVYVRVPKNGARHKPGEGTEVQILDDRSDRYKSLKPGQYCGSVYLLAPADPHVGRAAGEWNTMEINCKGADYRVLHNGIVVVDVTGQQVPALKERRLSGYLGLQNHSEPVYFRNVRVGPAY
jgi:hypothetical protein